MNYHTELQINIGNKLIIYTRIKILYTGGVFHLKYPRLWTTDNVVDLKSQIIAQISFNCDLIIYEQGQYIELDIFKWQFKSVIFKGLREINLTNFKLQKENHNHWNSSSVYSVLPCFKEIWNLVFLFIDEQVCLFLM